MTERVTGRGRRTREEIAKWNKMTALRFETGGRHQTSPASPRGSKPEGSESWSHSQNRTLNLWLSYMESTVVLATYNTDCWFVGALSPVNYNYNVNPSPTYSAQKSWNHKILQNLEKVVSTQIQNKIKHKFSKDQTSLLKQKKKKQIRPEYNGIMDFCLTYWYQNKKCYKKYIKKKRDIQKQKTLHKHIMANISATWQHAVQSTNQNIIP